MDPNKNRDHGQTKRIKGRELALLGYLVYKNFPEITEEWLRILDRVRTNDLDQNEWSTIVQLVGRMIGAYRCSQPEPDRQSVSIYSRELDSLLSSLYELQNSR